MNGKPIVRPAYGALRRLRALGVHGFFYARCPTCRCGWVAVVEFNLSLNAWLPTLTQFCEHLSHLEGSPDGPRFLWHENGVTADGLVKPEVAK